MEGTNVVALVSVTPVPVIGPFSGIGRRPAVVVRVFRNAFGVPGWDGAGGQENGTVGIWTSTTNADDQAPAGDTRISRSPNLMFVPGPEVHEQSPAPTCVAIVAGVRW